MSILLDSGIVYAYYDRRDAWHARARKVVEAARGGRIVPAPSIAEVDHLLGHRLGAPGRFAFYQGIVDGSYLVADLPRGAYPRVVEINRRFEDLDVGFVDAAIVAIAEALGVRRVATTDRRHFEPLAGAFRLQLVP